MNATEAGVSGSPKVLVPIAELSPQPDTISRSRGAMMDETVKNSGSQRLHLAAGRAHSRIEIWQ